MHPLNPQIDMCHQELRNGLTEIAAEWPSRFSTSEKAPALHFERCEKLRKGGLSVTFNGKKSI